MDGQHFDDLTRSLAIGASRRRVLRGLTGSILGGLLGVLGLHEASAACRLIDQRCDADNPCCTGAKCARGRCKCKTAAGYKPCNGPKTRCVNTNSSEAHCGTCGNRCPTGATCIQGQCFCPTTVQDVCGTSCVNTETDENHCGGCSDSCPKGGDCINGACSCPAGTFHCAESDACCSGDINDSQACRVGTPSGCCSRYDFCSAEVPCCDPGNYPCTPTPTGNRCCVGVGAICDGDRQCCSQDCFEGNCR